jgi:hypothetical protein
VSVTTHLCSCECRLETSDLRVESRDGRVEVGLHGSNLRCTCKGWCAAVQAGAMIWLRVAVRASSRRVVVGRSIAAKREVHGMICKRATGCGLNSPNSTVRCDGLNGRRAGSGDSDRRWCTSARSRNVGYQRLVQERQMQREHVERHSKRTTTRGSPGAQQQLSDQVNTCDNLTCFHVTCSVNYKALLYKFKCRTDFFKQSKKQLVWRGLVLTRQCHLR